MYKIDRRLACFIVWCDEIKKKAHKNYRETYHMDEFPKMSAPKHRAIVNWAVHYFYSGIYNGATEDEVNRLATYLIVCIDSAKHQLNYKQCRIDMGIDELIGKYASKGEQG